MMDIHGEFPYKLYLEIIGTNVYGRYIVVVSNKEFKLQGNNKIPLSFIRRNNGARQIGFVSEYNARMVSPIEIKRNNIEMYVFEIAGD